MPLVAIELEQEREMLQFCVGVFRQNAVAIQFLVHDIREEGLRNQGDFQITLIAGVVIHDIVGDIVRIERLNITIGIQGQTDRTRDAYRGIVGNAAVLVKGCLGVMAVFQAVLDLVAFNTACIAGLEDVVYVNIMFNSTLKRLVVKGCNENDKDALRWCVAKPDKRKSRKMSCRLFSELLYKEMGWASTCRYKILGYRIEFEGESLYVFDLVAAEVFHERKKKQSDEVMPTETSAENKEEAQPVNTRKGYYPDDIAGSFGVPVEQHRQESEVRQMDGYVSVGMLTGLPGQQQNT